MIKRLIIWLGCKSDLIPVYLCPSDIKVFAEGDVVRFLSDDEKGGGRIAHIVSKKGLLYITKLNKLGMFFMRKGWL